MPHHAGMDGRSALLLPLCLALLAPAAAWPSPAADDSLRVYRCVGSNGAVSLRDTPCTSGRQQVRRMQRPQDPPSPRVPAPDVPAPAPAATPAQARRELRYVQVAPLPPMYECVDDAGQRYVSDSNEGRPRWVPLWTHGWLPGRGPHRPWRHADRSPPAGAGPPPGSGASLGWGVSLPAGSMLVRDSCHALPPQEVCARLRDQRWALDRRYNSALQGERDAISREQRGIDAHLDQACGGR